MNSLAFHRYLNTLLLVVIGILITWQTTAEDYDSPHTFVAGDVLSADMLNEMFDRIKESKKDITAADLVGTYAVTHYLMPTWSGITAANLTMDADNILGTRSDTLTIFDDGDGTYSFQTTTYDIFSGNPSLASQPGTRRRFRVLSDMAFFGDKDSNLVDAVLPFRMVVKSGSRIVLTYNGGGSFAQVAICDKTDIAPTIPTGVTTSISGLNVTVSWTDGSSNETGFKVLRRDTLTGGFATLTTTASDVTSYTDTAPTVGTYWYRISATNANGDSVASKVVKVTVSN